MPNRSITVRVRGLHDPDDNADVERMTPAERMRLVWPLTVDAWAFMGEPIGESRLQRHVVRVDRRGR